MIRSDERDQVPVLSTAARLGAMESWHFWFRGRDELVSTLLRRFPTPGPIADVGCGTGSFAVSLRRVGLDVLALDREVGDLAVAGVPAVRADVEAVPLRDRSVGVVMARDVLEHVDDRASLLECHRMLRPGGLLIALVPAWPALWTARDERAGHRRRYTRASLRAALAGAGFELIELRGYQVVLLPLVAVSRLRARRRPAATLEAEEHPSPRLNSLFARVNLAEARWARSARLRPPTGSSLVAVARRP